MNVTVIRQRGSAENHILSLVMIDKNVVWRTRENACRIYYNYYVSVQLS